jgi:hypothetical protein
MNNMKHIKESWENYKSQTLPSDLPFDQLMEAKMGFYSGASSVYFRLMHAAQNPAVSEEEGEKLLDDIAEEIRNFTRFLAQGQAETFYKEA